ncbi:MAG TPA: hypothetical protein VGH38_20385 [Bryobacteraceae bacterium]
MNAVFASLMDVVRRLAAAVPAAWQGDRVFRWATMGVGLTLAMLLLDRGAGSQKLAPPPTQEAVQVGPAASAAGPSVSPEPTRAARGAAPAMPAVAPGQPLGATPPVRPGVGTDRFGTIAPQQSVVGLRP